MTSVVQRLNDIYSLNTSRIYKYTFSIFFDSKYYDTGEHLTAAQQNSS